MHRGTGIYVHQQTFVDLKIGDTFFDADYGDMIWNGQRWQTNDSQLLIDPQVGDLVHYIPFEGCDVSVIENGRIKAMGEYPLHLFVVYHCNDEWENYTDYTGALTHIKQLKYGWINPNNEENEAFTEE